MISPESYDEAASCWLDWVIMKHYLSCHSTAGEKLPLPGEWWSWCWWWWSWWSWWWWWWWIWCLWSSWCWWWWLWWWWWWRTGRENNSLFLERNLYPQLLQSSLVCSNMDFITEFEKGISHGQAFFNQWWNLSLFFFLLLNRKVPHKSCIWLFLNSSLWLSD